MEKEDLKVLIHAALAFVVIFGGFSLMEFYGGSHITARVVSSEEIETINCMDINEDCCLFVQGANKCEQYDGSKNPVLICSAGNKKVKLSLDVYDYCS
jgi:hypothetical protein